MGERRGRPGLASPRRGRGPHRRGQARGLQRGRRLRHGHDLRRPHRRHPLHVRGGHRGLLAGRADLPRFRGHDRLRLALEGLVELLRYRHQELRAVRVESPAAPLGLVGRPDHDPHRLRLGALQRLPHQGVPACRETEESNPGQVLGVATLRQDRRRRHLRRDLRLHLLRRRLLVGQVRAAAPGRLRRVGPLHLRQGLLQPSGLLALDHLRGRGELAVLPQGRGRDPPGERGLCARGLHVPKHRAHWRARALGELHWHDAHRRVGRPYHRILGRPVQLRPGRRRALRRLCHGRQRGDALRLQADVVGRGLVHLHRLKRLQHRTARDAQRRRLSDARHMVEAARLRRRAGARPKCRVFGGGAAGVHGQQEGE
mmetsp:Transcript_51773/g.150489  ORF Transcript_51773/g.150489 Transcript_51773/m.150489 type:complete len:371 (-) Transcript_51773:354-1466(-)